MLTKTNAWLAANRNIYFTLFFINKKEVILKFDMFVQDAGVEVDPLGDLNTELERKLGQLVLEK
jgi:hypothetical protein